MLDDYSRYIVAWELCKGMKAEDAGITVCKALTHAQMGKKARLKRLFDSGSSYVDTEFNNFLNTENILVVHVRPLLPQNHGKIKRYNRSFKNVVKLENYDSLGELELAVENFVNHYNHHSYLESINNPGPGSGLLPSGSLL